MGPDIKIDCKMLGEKRVKNSNNKIHTMIQMRKNPLFGHIHVKNKTKKMMVKTKLCAPHDQNKRFLKLSHKSLLLIISYSLSYVKIKFFKDMSSSHREPKQHHPIQDTSTIKTYPTRLSIVVTLNSFQ